MKLDRRQALGLLGAGAATASCGTTEAQPAAAFAHGVASGDPLQDRVVIWTRLSGAEGQTRVGWEVADDADFRRGPRRGVTHTDASRDGTVKVDVTGLTPGREYFYRFSIGGAYSPVGRTRTLPTGPTQDVVLAVASCALYPGGFFNAYEAIANQPRLDAVVHLGDYIYEYGPQGYGGDIGARLGRVVDPPHEIVTLADYRRRHAQVKSDPQLQAAHARAPWIVVWDDHETANDAWTGGAENHTPAKEGDWAARKEIALRAWYEWMPIRDPQPGRSFEAINRSFHFGDLASLIMVETRLAARSHQLDYALDLMVDGKPNPQAFGAKMADPSRTMMGEKQEAWLAQELASSVQSGRRWQVLGNQVVMARVAMPDVKSRMDPAVYAKMLGDLPADIQAQVVQAEALAGTGLPYNLDSWDGYPVARERLYGAFKATKATPIVLSGDSHAFWANELYDMGGQRVAAEFGATSISSPGIGDVLAGAPLNEGLVAVNKEVRYTDHSAKGFVLLTLTREAATAEMVEVSTIHAPQYQASVARRFRVEPAAAGVGALVEA
ncbi:MAG TPA: alkaline phosphatase D family protein [Caulobacteraceae bacterium]|nr:alkaline phosphatase D family protein [Caulobacteraceae bacterium]